MNSLARDFGSASCCTVWRQKLGFKRRCRGKKPLAFTNDSRSSFVPAGFMPDLYSAGDERRLGSLAAGMVNQAVSRFTFPPGQDPQPLGAFTHPLLTEIAS